MEAAAPTEDKSWIIELTAEVVVAYVSNNAVPVTDLPALISDVRNAFGDTAEPQESTPVEKQKPAVPVKKSVQADQITCLECGLKFKSLKRHLSANHDMSAADYREKWELSSDYPMVAPAYAEARSRLAKEAGFGQKGKMKKRPRR